MSPSATDLLKWRTAEQVYNVHLQQLGRRPVHWDNARYSFFVEDQHLRSLTKLSRRQEGRTGVSEKDLWEKYGLR